MPWVLMNALRHQANLSNSEMLELSELVPEIWKPIEGYEGIYDVSNKGHVRNSDGIILKHCYDKDGYPRLSLRKNGKPHTFTIHRLVAKAFCYNPCPEKYSNINHIDEVKTDNFYMNLEWCDNAYNHAYGTCGTRAGEKNSIPVVAEVIETGEKECYRSMTEAAERLGGDNSHICDCVNGKRKSAYGRRWQRYEVNCTAETNTAVMFENHSQDTRYTGPLKVAQTVSATYGTGGNNQPFVVESAGFCTEHSAKARGIGFEKETSPTLRAGVVPATLKIRCGGGSGGKGTLVQEDKSATLSCNNNQTLFVPKAYGICSKHSNSMMSDNPNSGFYEADTARTIDTSNQSPCKNQGGMVVIEGNGARPSHHGDGYKESDTMYCLNCTENHAVSYGIGRPAMNQSFKAKFSFQIEEEKSPTIVASGAGGVSHPKYSTSKSSHHTIAEKEKAGTLVASDYKDPPTVSDSTAEIEYIVRRLTPQECASLQGMPTWWCDGLETENPTDEEIDWWYDIFETHRKAIGKSTKPKSRKLVEKWLKNPYSDSAAYKMWGNGIFVGNAFFVLAGIACFANLGANCERSDTKLSS